MKYKLCAFTLLVVFGQAAATGDEKWVNVVVSNDGTRYDAKTESLEFSKTKAEVPIAVVIGRITKKNPATSYYINGTFQLMTV